MEDSEYQPLLNFTSALYETGSYESIQDIRPNGRPVSSRPVCSRSTIPEPATYGRNLTWTSAYILVISRVIGSGIFATPGSIMKSVGSVGLAPLVWLVGTVLAACGLAVSMEFGCMLPRSGGDKVYLEYTYRRPRFLVSTLIAVQAVLLGFTAELLKGRYQIINILRPIRTILKDLLAVADAHSVPDDDLVPTKLIYPNRVGETSAVRANPGFKWYFRYAQPPELVRLIKCFDSKIDGRARSVPHSAFVDPATEREAPWESIEVRALVFHPEDRE